jgi:predicted hydrocarbon binding protein
MSEENVFLKLVKEGKIEFTQDGKIIAFNEHIVQLPVRVLNKMFILLKENFGEDKAHEILKELGRFQVRQALERYIKILKLQEVEKPRLVEFATQLLISVGLGKYVIRSQNKDKYNVSISKTPLAEEFLLEYGKQEKPIDYYIAGMLESMFYSLTGKPMICEEVKCYAKGDDCCEFVVKPKE